MRFWLMLIVLILAGCGSDDEEVAPIVNFVNAHPPGGCLSDITPNGTITVTFDNPPRDVRVSAGTVTVAGNIATITGPFPPGPLALTINWQSGTQALNFVPCCCPIESNL